MVTARELIERAIEEQVTGDELKKLDMAASKMGGGKREKGSEGDRKVSYMFKNSSRARQFADWVDAEFDDDLLPGDPYKSRGYYIVDIEA